MATDVVDTVGAGDTFVGSVLVSLLDGNIVDGSALASLGTGEWEAIMSRAVVAAAITCSRKGADPPTSDELNRSLGP